MSLSYKVPQNGFINIWNTSGVLENPFSARMEKTQFRNYHAGASTKQANGKEIVSPAKAQYIHDKDFLHCQIPGNLNLSKLYWPSDTNQVDYSGMWKYPTDLVLYAEVTIISEGPCVQEMMAYCSGAIRIWCEGKEVLAFAPYQSNIQETKTFCLNLHGGANKILVAYNDYGERNILFRFAIQNCGAVLSCEVNASVSTDYLSQIKRFLDSLYLKSFSICDEQLVIYSEASCPFDIPLKISIGNNSETFIFPQNEQSLPLWESSIIKAGFQSLSVSFEDGDIRIENQLQVEVVHSENLRPSTETDIRKRKSEYIEFIKDEEPESIPGIIAALSSDNPFNENLDIYSDLFYMIEHRGDCADFRMIRLLWIFILGKNRFSESFYSKVKKLILSFRYWYDEPGNDAMWFFSENHALSFHVAEYLAGGLFEEEIFSNSGLRGIEHKQKATELLSEWFDHLLNQGYNEWNSITYIPVDLIAFFTLYEFCDNEELKNKVKHALDYTFSVFSAISFEGMLVGSSGRIYAQDLFASRTHETGSLCRIAWGKGNLAVSDCSLFFALSSYEPPISLEKDAEWKQAGLYEYSGISGRTGVRISTVKNRNFILSSSTSPREGGPGSQEQLVNAMLTDWRGRFWINNPGELKIWGTRRPGFFTGNALTPKVSQQHQSVLLSWKFSKEAEAKEEANFTQLIAYFDLFDDVRIHEKYVVLRLGNAFAFIYAENGIRKSGIPSLKRFQVISDGLDNIWYVRVADADEIEYNQFLDYAARFSISLVDGKAKVDDFSYGWLEFPLMNSSLYEDGRYKELKSGDDVSICLKSNLCAYPWNRGSGSYEACYRPDIHYTEIVSPLRRIYETDNAFINGERPIPTCEIVSIPANGNRAEFSRFFFTPHEVSFAAAYTFEILTEGLYEFCVHTCSLIKVYADDNLVVSDFNSMRIIERCVSFSVHFTKGTHVLKIVADDLAERDSQLYIRLTYTGTEKILQLLPQVIDSEVIAYAKRIMDSLYLDKQTYCDNNVNVMIGEEITKPLNCNLILSYPDSNAETESIETAIVLKPGDMSISIGHLLFKPFGLINVAVSTIVNGCVLTAKFEAEYYTINESGAETIAERKLQALRFYAKYGNKTFQTLLAKCHVCKFVDAEIFDMEMDKIESHYDCSDFRLSAVIYALRNFTEYFSSEQLTRMREAVLNFRYWSDEPGDDVMWYFSENHAINFHVAELLAGELYGDELFPVAGITGSEHVKRATKRINAWFDNFEKNGFIEWNSSVYIPIDLIAIFSLVSMSSNKELVERGSKILDLIFDIIASNSFKGVMSSSYGRIYFKNLIGRRVGEISALNWIASGRGFLNHHSFSTVLFCLSAYEPSERILQEYNTEEPLVVRNKVKLLDLDVYAYKTADYIISSALNKKQDAKGTQEHLFHVTAVNPDCQLWINHPGELSYFGEGRPSYWAGSLSMPKVRQDRNKAELQFGHLAGEADFTHMYVPLRFFDSWNMCERYLVVEKCNVYVYVSARNGLSLVSDGPFCDSEVRSYGNENVWRVWVSEKKLTESDLQSFVDFDLRFI